MQRDEGRKEGRTAEGGQPAGRGKQSDNTREAFEYFRSAAYHYTDLHPHSSHSLMFFSSHSLAAPPAPCAAACAAAACFSAITSAIPGHSDH